MEEAQQPEPDAEVKIAADDGTQVATAQVTYQL